MGWELGGGETGGQPAPMPRAPGGTSRDDLLSGFARGGQWDQCPPGPELAAVLAAAGGPEWRCPGAEPDELIGVVRRLAALESWASAAKLAVVRELIRQDDSPALARPRHGDLPDQWSESLNHELALALAVSVPSAEQTTLTAWELGARLPGIAALHADGTLSYSKAKLIVETFQLLSDADAAQAEAMIIPQLTGTTGKTWGQIMNLAARIANEVDPGLAERRRKAAVKHASRVQMFRERSGAAGLSGRDLPAGETMAAYASVDARAAEYKDSGVFPGALMDQLRTTAYLDLINAVPAEARIAQGHLSTDTADLNETPDALITARQDHGSPGETETGRGRQPRGDEPGDSGPGGGPSGGGPDDRAPGGDSSGGPAAGHAVTSDLVIPLATLLGLADRPGEVHGLGVLDPDLCRDLARIAAASPHSQICLTVTDPDGIAIGHGCGRTGRAFRAAPAQPGTSPPSLALPARVNLTITADRLSAMLVSASASVGWTLTRRDARGSPDSAGDQSWCGTWTLTLPGGRELAVRIEPVPTHACDHRHESRGYQPNGTLRHLVQVRDHTCTFPPCSRHARDSDFEHAQPYDKGGRTCSCNAGARSRKCHRVKQSPGWTVTQPKPGWHEWTTPSGRTYVQAPYRYPV